LTTAAREAGVTVTLQTWEGLVQVFQLTEVAAFFDRLPTSRLKADEVSQGIHVSGYPTKVKESPG
jgi:hypothetical protein